MTGRERFMTALQLGQPDRVPMFDYFNEQSIVGIGQLIGHATPPLANPLTYTQEESDAVFQLTLDLVKELDLDAISIPLSLGLTLRPDGVIAEDRLGCVYRLSDHGEAVPWGGPITTRETLCCLAGLSPLPSDTTEVAVACAALPDRAVVFSTPGPFDLSWTLMGSMEEYLPNLVLEAEFCLDLARLVTDFIVLEVQQAVHSGAGVVMVEGDLAAELQPLISPAHYRRFVLPFHKRIVDVAHSLGAPVIKHSDGNLWPLLDDLLSAGFDGLHPIQPQCMDIAEAKRRLAGRACVIGNIDCVELLPYGEVADVVRAVQQTIRVAAPGGGYILSSSNSIHPHCRPRNTVAMYAAAHEYGGYPIH